MGPASENAGYAGWQRMLACIETGFNGSGVRERRLCSASMKRSRCLRRASMGPASENAGYGWRDVLQNRGDSASMGPASENAGYAVKIISRETWREGASMGPASENAGYADLTIGVSGDNSSLQWVRRPRTPVMLTRSIRIQVYASMGPGSENAGYVCPRRLHSAVEASMVRRPRTPVMNGLPFVIGSLMMLQWVRRPRTPVMLRTGTCERKCFRLQWVGVRERRLCFVTPRPISAR